MMNDELLTKLVKVMIISIMRRINSMTVLEHNTHSVRHMNYSFKYHKTTTAH
jgi:hypothetical protein